MAFRFTTSWDDGSVLDIRVADLLSRHGMKGTFYVPKQFDGKGGKFSAYNRRLNEEEICDLALRHEVGGHSLTHRSLLGLSSEEINQEIAGSQEFLEDITGNPAGMFAFPRGSYDVSVVNSVQQARFVGARTTEKLTICKPEDPFLMGVTIICQPFPFRKVDTAHYYWHRLLDPLHAYHPMQLAFSWQALARKIFKKAYAQGNYFHLYGHSWEIEKYGMWEDLDIFLDFVKNHEDVMYLTNGELVAQIL